ncbi:hypothetical protein JS530_03080 [Bifidobacterium sp. LC6]|uniref:Uncharacterized protein n=2 Tax=Bifidobacterium colobi TaxID=2809026 RepID=A0ABS5UTX3_9BIFI|nr:hypothetical protein [Bifidobacterium colobi]
MVLAIGVLSAPAIAFTFAFNMFRYYRLMKKRIHPMLIKEGLRKADDPWVSSGVADDVEEHYGKAATRMDADAEVIRESVAKDASNHDVNSVDSLVDSPEINVQPSHASVPKTMRLPSGPYDAGAEALNARHLFEFGDVRLADRWVEGNDVSGDVRSARLNAWRNEVLFRCGLDSQPEDVVRAIERRAGGIALFRKMGPAGAYLQACEETLGTKDV